MSVNKNHERAQPPPPLPGMERVDQLKILGVTMNTNKCNTVFLSDDTVCIAYTMSTLMVRTLVHYTVFSYDIVAKIMYGSPAWYGFTDSVDRGRLNSLLQKSKKCEFKATEDDFNSKYTTADNLIIDSLKQ